MKITLQEKAREKLDIRGGKPVIEQLVISPEVTQKANKIITATNITSQTRITALRKLVGGLCCSCYGVPTKKVIYSPIKDIKLLEYYCDKCFKLQ